ncbi:MAG: sigma-70 family RNA polymerase sigma factor [Actinomycetota bacterium]
MTELLSGVDAPSDAELISAVRGGDVAAYGELFSRHVQAARRLGRQLVRGTDVDDLVSDAFAKTLQVLQNGGGPDVAFRAYLLTSVRRLHVDRIRASKRVQPSDDMTEFDDGIPFQDTAVASFENGAAAKAFASLPERWQLVLWHLEVEGQKPADIAPLLGMSPNSVSALAYRAREGLRQAFLTMHLADSATEQCRWTNEHLGAFVRSGLSKRDTTKVQSHLDECRRCTAMYLELNEVNSNLAGIIAPLLLGAAAAGYVSSAGAGATGIAAVFGRIRDALTGNAGGGSGAATTTSTGGVASGGAASGGAAAATGAAGAAGAAATGAAVAAGSAATLGGILTVGGAIAAGVAVVTTAAFVVGGGGDKETVTEADRPAVVQTPTEAAAPSELDTSGTDPEASEDPSAAPSDEATVDYVVPNPGTASVDPAATTDTPPSSSPQDVAPPPAPAPADPAPGAPAPNDPAPNDPPADEPGPAPAEPTSEPTTEPTAEPTAEPTSEPTTEPTASPTALPSSAPTTVAPPPQPSPEPSSTTTPPPGPLTLTVSNSRVESSELRFTLAGDPVLPVEFTVRLTSPADAAFIGANGGPCFGSDTQVTCHTLDPTSAGSAGMPSAATTGSFEAAIPIDAPSGQPVLFSISAVGYSSSDETFSARPEPTPDPDPEPDPAPEISFGDPYGEGDFRYVRVTIANLSTDDTPTFGLDGATRAQLQRVAEDRESGDYVVRVHMPEPHGVETVAIRVTVGSTSKVSDPFEVGRKPADGDTDDDGSGDDANDDGSGDDANDDGSGDGDQTPVPDDGETPDPGEVEAPSPPLVSFDPWLGHGAFWMLGVRIDDLPDDVEPQFALLGAVEAELHDVELGWRRGRYLALIHMPAGKCEETVRLQVTIDDTVATSEPQVVGRDRKNC